MPQRAQAVVALATDTRRGQGAAARNLVERFVGADVAVAQAQDKLKQTLGLSGSDELAPLLGNDLVAARTAAGVVGAWVVRDQPDLRAILSSQVTRHRLARQPSAGGYDRYGRPGMSVAVRGALLLVGQPPALTRALADRARGAGLTPRLFDQRLRGLPADSLLRAEGDLSLSSAAQRSKIAWVRALNRFAITVRADDSGLHARLRAASTPVAPADLPLAPGATPPSPLGRTNGATAGVRELSHVIRFGVRALHLTGVPSGVIDQLAGTATVWTPDLKTFTVTVAIVDPGALAKALARIRPLVSRLLTAAGLPGARYGITGRTFIATTDPASSLARLAAGRPQRLGSLRGALTGVVRGATLGQAIIDRLGLPPIASIALGALGDTTFAVRMATTGVEASADVSIR